MVSACADVVMLPACADVEVKRRRGATTGAPRPSDAARAASSEWGAVEPRDGGPLPLVLLAATSPIASDEVVEVEDVEVAPLG